MVNDNAKPRTLQELAKEACDVQNASNLSGVAHSFARALGDLRRLPECTGNAWLHSHPVTRAWVDKIASLAGMQGDDLSTACRAHVACMQLAERGGK